MKRMKGIEYGRPLSHCGSFCLRVIDRLDLGMVGEEDKGKVELVIDTDGCAAQRAESTFVSLTSKPRHCATGQ